jgi:hypothetical protein
MMVGLFALGVTSYFLRRVLGHRAARRDPEHRAAAFYWAHVWPTVVAALAAPLGIAYGWWVNPRLEAVIPFWVVALTLGFLALPRAGELDDFDRAARAPGSGSGPGASPS